MGPIKHVYIVQLWFRSRSNDPSLVGVFSKRCKAHRALKELGLKQVKDYKSLIQEEWRTPPNDDARLNGRIIRADVDLNQATNQWM